MYPYKGSVGDFVFVHIPKTGGSSIKQLYQKHKSSSHYFHGSGRRDGCGKNGHIAFNSEIEAKYFTILRNPITRYWSHYWQYRKNKHRRKDPVSWVLEDNWDNIVSSFITGKIHCTFDEVIECVKNYTYVGKFENFNQTYSDISRMLGLENAQRFWLNKRKRSHAKPIPEDFISVVNNKNQIDFRVYNWCEKNIWCKE
tara:strand:- start:97 stop:690 length:594 start_codon:yes stop_codon:yes gene_type:complete